MKYLITIPYYYPPLATSNAFWIGFPVSLLFGAWVYGGSVCSHLILQFTGRFKALP